MHARGVARWCWHVNGVHAPASLRDWLTDRASLTLKLSAASGNFRVQRLRQQSGVCLADECEAIGLPRPITVQEREVLLRCDDCPVVFAHTVVPLPASAADWPFFGTLGERSLGTTLFGDPRVARGPLQFARLHPAHPLARRAGLAIGAATPDDYLYARRCLFRRKKGLLLVTEVFLPAVTQLAPPNHKLARTSVAISPVNDCQ